MISFNDFKRLELKVGKVLEAERIAGAEKLLKLRVDLNEPGLPSGRQIVAGIAQFYEPEKLLGKQVVIAANLEPKVLMGVESQGMLLAANDGKPVLITTNEDVAPGSLIS